MVGMEDVNEPATGNSTERDANGTEAIRCAYVPSNANARPRSSGLLRAKDPPAVSPTSLLCAFADTATKRAKQPSMVGRTNCSSKILVGAAAPHLSGRTPSRSRRGNWSLGCYPDRFELLRISPCQSEVQTYPLIRTLQVALRGVVLPLPCDTSVGQERRIRPSEQ